jgi:hypothetical protein
MREVSASAAARLLTKVLFDFCPNSLSISSKMILLQFSLIQESLISFPSFFLAAAFSWLRFEGLNMEDSREHEVITIPNLALGLGRGLFGFLEMTKRLSRGSFITLPISFSHLSISSDEHKIIVQPDHSVKGPIRGSRESIFFFC